MCARTHTYMQACTCGCYNAYIQRSEQDIDCLISSLPGDASLSEFPALCRGRPGCFEICLPCPIVRLWTLTAIRDVFNLGAQCPHSGVQACRAGALTHRATSPAARLIVRGRITGVFFLGWNPMGPCLCSLGAGVQSVPSLMWVLGTQT